MKLEEALREAGDGYVRRAGWPVFEVSLRRLRGANGGMTVPGAVFEDALGKRVLYDDETLAGDDWMVVSPKEPDNMSDDTGRVGRERRALRRLQNEPPSEFEQIIDALYTWREYTGPQARVTDLMRRLINQNHNVSDTGALAAIRGYVREARTAKIDAAIAKLGLDEAERILGLKESDE